MEALEMSDQRLETYRSLLEYELGETLREVFEQLNGLWPQRALVELMMLLGLGVLNGMYTPNQVIERLGLDKNKIYRNLGAGTAQEWRQIILGLGYTALLSELTGLLEKSESSRSRVRLTIILDDSLFRRYARQMASIFKWWGGAFKAVRKGHDVLGLMIEINGRVFILDWIVASKTGRKRKKRWQYAIEMLQEFAHRMKEAGIDPSLFGLAMDWWYGQVKELVEAAADLGLTVVSEPGTDDVFIVKGQKQRVSQLKEKFLRKSDWGGIHTQRIRASSNTFGEVILVLYRDNKGEVHLLMAKAKENGEPRKDIRGLIVIRIFQKRQWIEQVWRWQKSSLKTGKIQVRKKHKPKAGYACRMVTYAILLALQQKLRKYRAIGRQSIGTILDWYQRLASAVKVLFKTLGQNFRNMIPQNWTLDKL
jgi:hypothetical protein